MKWKPELILNGLKIVYEDRTRVYRKRIIFTYATT